MHDGIVSHRSCRGKGGKERRPYISDGFSGFYIRLPQLSFLYSAPREIVCLLIKDLSNRLPLPSRALEHLRQFVAPRCVSEIHQKSIAGK